jgi:HAD superfamily hydrolase (TIGR01549 family)
MRWIRNIKAIGFDLDGTLYPADAIPKSLIRTKQIETIAQVNGWSDLRAEQELMALLVELGSNTKAMTALGVNGTSFFTDIWDNLPLEQYIIRDDLVVQMFIQLKNKYRLFIISNSNRRDQIEKKLELIGLQPAWFEPIVSTVEVGKVKPEPEPFLTALSKMPDLTVGEVLYVGDRVETDVVGAKRVGMRACLVGKGELDLRIKGAVGEQHDNWSGSMASDETDKLLPESSGKQAGGEQRAETQPDLVVEGVVDLGEVLGKKSMEI